MIIRAARDIKEGEEIAHSYVDPQVAARVVDVSQESVLVRRELLQLGKFFLCGCARCGDPTELTTYGSALTCPKCRWQLKSCLGPFRGPVISTEASMQTADWTCINCGKMFDCLKV